MPSISPRSFGRPVARLIDATWREPDLVGDAFARKIGFRDVGCWRSERPKGAHDASSIVRCGVDPDIKVPGRARAAMKRERVGAHHEKADVSGDERAQQIDKIRVHRSCLRAGATSAG